MAPTADNRWARIPIPVKPHRFGAAEDFEWYLAGPSKVAVSCLADICEWLRDCRYDSDENLFGSRDYWQHPEEFERLRAGDCEDHALWAWRKLLEIGVNAEFVVGCVTIDERPDVGHAWVIFHDPDGPYLLEAAAKWDDPIVSPLAEVAMKYMPHHAIDGRLQTTTFIGSLLNS